jgi:hypothetical protein
MLKIRVDYSGHGGLLINPSVMSVEDPADKTTWTTFWNKMWRGDPVRLRGLEALSYIETHTTPLRDVFQSSIDWTPDATEVRIDEMQYWVPRA